MKIGNRVRSTVVQLWDGAVVADGCQDQARVPTGMFVSYRWAMVVQHLIPAHRKQKHLVSEFKASVFMS